MILTSKQLEELEHVSDSTGALADSDGSENKDEDVTEAALEWRRQLIEEAAEAIKRAQTRPVDETMTYEVSSLLFDRETRRFGRVQASVPGYLKIGYITGGDREWGLLNAEPFLKEHGDSRPPIELAEQLGLTEDDVLEVLDRLGIKPLRDDNEEHAAPAETPQQASAQKVQPISEAKQAKAPKVTKAPSKPKGRSTGVEEANSYIKKNYKKLSNKELAAATGLSEHTIRRKLGEWGLKRKR
jgi:hypothetical protein